MSLFHHVSFQTIDPEDNGLHEEIEAEQQEADAITLEEGLSEDNLGEYLKLITQDIEKDPNQFKYTEEE